jgi:hypothetical protein
MVFSIGSSVAWEQLEELGVELITPGLYRVFFRDMEIGELNSGRASLQSCAKSGLRPSMSALACSRQRTTKIHLADIGL